jgi:hypothetical protein
MGVVFGQRLWVNTGDFALIPSAGLLFPLGSSMSVLRRLWLARLSERGE